MTRSRERGVVGGLEAIPFGLLIFVVAVLMIANAWAVVDAKVAVTAAAREAARTWVEGDGSDDAARDAAAEALVGHGRDPQRLELELDAPTGFGRCAPVVVRATYHVPALPLPWIGGFGDGFDVSSHHSERVDPFRDGIEGEAAC
jgi:Flp pilus assembly protein TadG